MFSFHLLGIDLQSPVHAGAGQVGGVLPEPHARGDGGVLGDDLESVPLLAEVDPHVGPGHSQVGAAGVEAEVLDLVSLVERQSLEVTKFPEIPELDTTVLRSSGQIVT